MSTLSFAWFITEIITSSTLIGLKLKSVLFTPLPTSVVVSFPLDEQGCIEDFGRGVRDKSTSMKITPPLSLYDIYLGKPLIGSNACVVLTYQNKYHDKRYRLVIDHRLPKDWSVLLKDEEKDYWIGENQ